MELAASSLLALSAILVASGCSAPRAVASRPVTLSSANAGGRGAPRLTPPVTPALAAGLQAGDYIVYRFSGSFHAAAPLTLTERVLGRDGGVLTLELVLDEGTRKETLHVRKDATPGSAEEVFDVTRLDAAGERSASVDAYAAMMAKTVLAADQNDEQLGTERTSVLVGNQTLPCTKTSYRVRVGKRIATMSTVESAGFAWGDVAGDITTLEGQVLYRVEIIDAGHERAGDAVTARR